MPTVMFVPRLCVPLLEGDFSLISIGDPGQEDEFAANHPERLRLEFHDVDDYIGDEYAYFNYFVATKVLIWLELQAGRDIVVHCEAGISRSVAIAKFMIETLGYEFKASERSLNGMSRYNQMVYHQIRVAHMDRQTVLKQTAKHSDICN